VYVYFNNTAGDGFENARRLQRLLGMDAKLNGDAKLKR
jgi:hypothetical protein